MYPEEKFYRLTAIAGSLLKQKQYAQLRGMLLPLEPADVAQLMDSLSGESIPLLFRLLPEETAGEVFVELTPEHQQQLINDFSNSELRAVLDELYLDDAADIVEEMPPDMVRRILAHAAPEMRTGINQILNYPKDSAGALMTTELIDLEQSMTVSDCFQRIRREAENVETIDVCYVVDAGRRLTGFVTIRALMLAAYEDTVGEIMDNDPISAVTQEDQELVARRFGRYDLTAMPVVDTGGRLVGIITADDVMDVMQEETTEDIQKMAGMLPSETPYLRSSVRQISASRLPWLLLLMLSSTFTAQIISSYEDALAACMVLTSFITMLSDTGGNSGAQSSAEVIRALSLHEIGIRDTGRVLWKELRVALLSGVTLAAVNFGKMMLVDRLLMSNPAVTVAVALVVSLTIIVTVVAAKLLGALFPILANQVGLDPAVLASPFITTVVDALSLLIYFGIAVLLLHI
ncbi:MAG: magnesium transporter [Clostridiales bacterium]|nr:magnesium transporter [Clostridiales bacterium]